MSTRIESWNTIRPVTVTSKINKTITLGSFSAISYGEHKHCVYYGQLNTFNYFGASDWTDFRTALTLGVWLKFTSNNRFSTDNRGIFSRELSNGGSKSQFALFHNTVNGKMVFAYTKGGVETLITSTQPAPLNAWFHFAVTWDGVTIKMFCNGVQDLTTASLTPNLDAYVSGSNYIGIAPNLDNANSFVDELCIWNVAKTPDDLAFIYDKPRDPSGILDSSLKGYFKFNETNGTLKNLITNNTYNGILQTDQMIDGDGAPLKLGASRIFAKVNISLGVKASLKFPISATGLNFGIVVSWTDDNGVFQRRFLYNPGCDINPPPAIYNGEMLSSSFCLELWTIDGNESAVLASDLVIPYSVLTQPSSEFDHAPINTTYTRNTNIYEPFPLANFPLTFDNPKV